MKKISVILLVLIVVGITACSDGPQKKVEAVGDTVEVFVVPEPRVKPVAVEIIEDISVEKETDTLSNNIND